jgi:hypothetical protein
MTRRLLNLISVSTLLAATACFGAETRVASVKVPFEFRAGEEVMPAGEYQITKSDQSVLFLRTKGKSVALLPVGAGSALFNSKNVLRFERVSGQPVLTEVSVEGGQGFLFRH